MRRRVLTSLVLSLCVSQSAIAQIAGVNGYYRQPSIRGNTIAFVSEGDIWLVGTNGGVATRLTTNLAQESNPFISPDGRTIAFTGRYDGVADVYTIPLTGGTPRRHSWDADAQVTGWTDDGKIIYTTRRYSTLPANQLFTVDPQSHRRNQIPLYQAFEGSWDRDGVLYFTRLHQQGSHTKRYKAGTAQNIWKWRGVGGEGSRGDKSEAVCLTCDYTGTSRYAKWWNGRIYFTSDRDGVMNIWSMNPDGKDLQQHTFHKDYDVREFSIDNGKIVYHQGADLHLIPSVGSASSLLKISISSDLEQMRTRYVRRPMDYLTDYHIDKTGDRVALIARGMVFVAPVGQGRFVTLPNRGGVRNRDMRFAPDGKSLYTLNDRSGEVELWKTPADGTGVGEQLTRDATILRWDLEVSPDGRYIVHDDKNQKLWLYDVAAKSNKLIDASTQGGHGYWWSPDSKSGIYTDAGGNGIGRIYLYEVATGSSKVLTSGWYNSYSPVITPDGVWLYFLSNRTFNTSVSSPWGQGQPEPHFNNQTKIYALQLKRGPRFPFAPKDEVSRDTVEVHEGAVFEVPIAAGNYSHLQTDGKRLYYVARDSRYSGGNPKIMSLELKNQDVKAETFVEGPTSFELSADNKKILFRKGDDLYVVPAGAKAPTDLASSKLDLSGWMLQLERKEEMKSLFVDAWRLERDYFYDPNMHGVDWAAMKTKYMPLAERVSDRAELSDVIAQMVGELSALHIYVYGGDLRAGSDTVPHASLGAVLEPVGGNGGGNATRNGWRVSRIYRNDPDVPGELSPLAMPGIDVSEGRRHHCHRRRVFVERPASG